MDYGTNLVPRNGDEKARSFGKEIVIGGDCFIWGSVVIISGITIGNAVTVGAGSVVTKDVEPRCDKGGSPAKTIRRLDAKPRDIAVKTGGLYNERG